MVFRVLNKWKKKIEKIFLPLGNLLSKLSISPNYYSAFGFLLAILSGYFIYNAELLLGAFFLLASGAMDLLDGLVARVKGQVTQFGGVLDSVLDRYSDVIILSALILSNRTTVFWGLAALIGSLMVSYTRARIEVTGVKMSGIGLLERPERTLLIIIGLLFEHFAIFPAVNVLHYIIIFLAIVTQISVIQRLFYGFKSLEQEKSIEKENNPKNSKDAEAED